MCIRYCDDGNPAGVEDIVTALELGVSVDEIYKYLTYDDSDHSDDLVALIGRGGDRFDTLEYLRWYPEMWGYQRRYYAEFCRLYDY